MLYADRWPVKGLVSRHIQSGPGEDGDAFKEMNDGDVSSRNCLHAGSFSSARHGSTWYLESTESCRASRCDKPKECGHLATSGFRVTELWKHVRSEFYNKTGDLGRDVTNNRSIKVLSSSSDVSAPVIATEERKEPVFIRPMPFASKMMFSTTKQTASDIRSNNAQYTTSGSLYAQYTAFS